MVELQVRLPGTRAQPQADRHRSVPRLRDCSRRWPKRVAAARSRRAGLARAELGLAEPGRGAGAGPRAGRRRSTCRSRSTASRFEVAGILPPGAYRQAVGLLDIGEAQWRLRRLGRLDRIDLRLEPRADRAAVRAAIDKSAAAGRAGRHARRGDRRCRAAHARVPLEPDRTRARRALHRRVPRLRDAVARGRAASTRDRLAARDGHDGARATRRVAAGGRARRRAGRGARRRARRARAHARASLRSAPTWAPGISAGWRRHRSTCAPANTSSSSLLGVAASLVATYGPAREAASVPGGRGAQGGRRGADRGAPARLDRRSRCSRRRWSRSRCRRSTAWRCPATSRSRACCSAPCC